MKKLLLTLAFVGASLNLTAQNTANTTLTATDEEEGVKVPTVAMQSNTVYAEVGGNGELYSVNFDQVVLSGKNFNISFRVGLGLSSSIFKGDIDPIIPLEGNIWFGTDKHHFETGLGVVAAFGFEETLPVTVQFTDNGTKIAQFQPAREHTSLYAFTRFGYRYQQKDGGLFFRAGINPTVTAYAKSGDLNPKLEANIGIGYTFKTKKPAQIPLINYN